MFASWLIARMKPLVLLLTPFRVGLVIVQLYR